MSGCQTANSTQPTVIIFGTGDRLVPNAYLHGGFTSTTMKNGQSPRAGNELVTLEGCGHTVQFDCTDAFNAALFS